MTASKDPHRRFFDALGFSPADTALFQEALTHRSFVNEVTQPGGPPLPDNERLEYLGDAVLDLLVADALVRRFPGAREGELSRMRSAIVHEGALAAVARRLHLGAVLKLGRGEDLSGGRDRPSLLADAFEAVVAAIYLEVGFERTLKVVLPLLDFDQGRDLAEEDPKTALQQHYQAERKVTPRYRVAATEGPEHEQRFVVEVLVGDEVLGTGEGRSKKQAERDAASRLLDDLQVEKPGGIQRSRGLGSAES